MTVFGKVFEWVKSLPSLVKWIVGAGLLVVLAVLLWWMLTGGWNKIGNYLFHKQINAERVQVGKELADAAEQKKALEKTLLDYKQAKDELITVKAEKDRLEKLFNDQSKTAAEKVAAFKAAVADDPVRTPTDGVTVDDLCARAKAIGSSPATIATLCRQ